MSGCGVQNGGGGCNPVGEGMWTIEHTVPLHHALCRSSAFPSVFYSSEAPSTLHNSLREGPGMAMLPACGRVNGGQAREWCAACQPVVTEGLGSDDLISLQAVTSPRALSWGRL